MISDIVNIDWTKLETAFSAFITIIGVPLTYSITYASASDSFPIA